MKARNRWSTISGFTNMSRIHILVGIGSNCTCGDCAVLYGGDCYTTPTNNMLDKIDKVAAQIIGLKGYICKTDTHRFLEEIRPLVCKQYKLTNKQFDKHYYLWLPFLYMAMGYGEGDGNYSKSSARQMYRRARRFVLSGIEKDLTS